MSLKMGIIGLPNVGKSTLFNALVSQKQAQVSDYPFCTIEPNKKAVEVPNKKLKKLAKVLDIPKTVTATLEIVDIAGLVKGAHKGEGLGNEFLSHIQEVDILCQVLPYFKSIKKAEKQKEIIKTELILKDLQWVNQALENAENDKEKEILERAKKALSKEKRLEEITLSKEERNVLDKHNLLTDKEIFFVANVKEEEIGSREGKGIIEISAKTEEDLIELNKKEQKEYRKALEIKENALDKIIKKSYNLLNLISFYTIKDDQSQIQAWAVEKDTPAKKAGGIIHSDFEKKFIQAQVVKADDLIEAESLKKAGEKGLIKVKGENYPIKNHQVVKFKHG